MLIGNLGRGRPLRESGYWLEAKSKIYFKYVRWRMISDSK
jgi:hypothetical protein